MLKSNIIDAKYRDAKGEFRTPSIVTSVTEDEIKNTSFAPGDILPASAVLMAVNAAGGNPFPIPYYKDSLSQFLIFDINGSGNNEIWVDTYHACICFGSTGQMLLRDRYCEFDYNGRFNVIYPPTNRRVEIDGESLNVIEQVSGYDDLIAKLEPTRLTLSDERTRNDEDHHTCIYECSSIKLDVDDSGNAAVSISPGAMVFSDSPGVNASIDSRTDGVNGYLLTLDDVAINKRHLETLQKVLTNSSKSISDVDTSAALSALISSYNSLLAHLRTSGILKA